MTFDKKVLDNSDKDAAKHKRSGKYIKFVDDGDCMALEFVPQTLDDGTKTYGRYLDPITYKNGQVRDNMVEILAFDIANHNDGEEPGSWTAAPTHYEDLRKAIRKHECESFNVTRHGEKGSKRTYYTFEPIK